MLRRLVHLIRTRPRLIPTAREVTVSLDLEGISEAGETDPDSSGHLSDASVYSTSDSSATEDLGSLAPARPMSDPNPEESNAQSSSLGGNMTQDSLGEAAGEHESPSSADFAELFVNYVRELTIQSETASVSQTNSQLVHQFPAFEVEKGAFLAGSATCPICLEEYSGQVVMLPCLCAGHFECFEKALTHDARCPVHRIDLQEHLLADEVVDESKEGDDNALDRPPTSKARSDSSDMTSATDETHTGNEEGNQSWSSQSDAGDEETEASPGLTDQFPGRDTASTSSTIMGRDFDGAGASALSSPSQIHTMPTRPGLHGGHSVLACPENDEHTWDAWALSHQLYGNGTATASSAVRDRPSSASSIADESLSVAGIQSRADAMSVGRAGRRDDVEAETSARIPRLAHNAGGATVGVTPDQEWNAGDDAIFMRYCRMLTGENADTFDDPLETRYRRMISGEDLGIQANAVEEWQASVTSGYQGAVQVPDDPLMSRYLRLVES